MAEDVWVGEATCSIYLLFCLLSTVYPTIQPSEIFKRILQNPKPPLLSFSCSFPFPSLQLQTAITIALVQIQRLQNQMIKRKVKRTECIVHIHMDWRLKSKTKGPFWWFKARCLFQFFFYFFYSWEDLRSVLFWSDLRWCDLMWSGKTVEKNSPYLSLTLPTQFDSTFSQFNLLLYNVHNVLCYSTNL